MFGEILRVKSTHADILNCIFNIFLQTLCDIHPKSKFNILSHLSECLEKPFSYTNIQIEKREIFKVSFRPDF